MRIYYAALRYFHRLPETLCAALGAGFPVGETRRVSLISDPRLTSTSVYHGPSGCGSLTTSHRFAFNVTSRPKFIIESNEACRPGSSAVVGIPTMATTRPDPPPLRRGFRRGPAIGSPISKSAFVPGSESHTGSTGANRRQPRLSAWRTRPTCDHHVEAETGSPSPNADPKTRERVGGNVNVLNNDSIKAFFL